MMTDLGRGFGSVPTKATVEAIDDDGNVIEDTNCYSFGGSRHRPEPGLKNFAPLVQAKSSFKTYRMGKRSEKACKNSGSHCCERENVRCWHVVCVGGMIFSQQGRWPGRPSMS